MPDKARNHHTINKTLLYYSIQKLKKNQLFKEIERALNTSIFFGVLQGG